MLNVWNGRLRSAQVELGGGVSGGLCLGPYGSPRGGAASYERGTPVWRVEIHWGRARRWSVWRLTCLGAREVSAHSLLRV